MFGLGTWRIRLLNRLGTMDLFINDMAIYNSHIYHPGNKAKIPFLSSCGYKMFLKKPIVKVNTLHKWGVETYSMRLIHFHSFYFPTFHLCTEESGNMVSKLVAKKTFIVFPFNNKDLICFVKFTILKSSFFYSFSYPLFDIFE